MTVSDINQLLKLTDAGLYCPAGDFYIDPWRPVQRAVITHAHSDHARRGNAHYLATPESEPILRSRLGHDISLQPCRYGSTVSMGSATLSLHPAGHMRGSAQVRIDVGGKIAIVTGDYKRGSDPTGGTFEPVPCDLLVTESTFGLPIFRWPSSASVFDDINQWWRENQSVGKTSVLYAYAVGKSQRILTGLDPSIGPIYCHGAVDAGNKAYEQSGCPLPPYQHVAQVETATSTKVKWHQGIVIAPPSAHGTPWLRRFGSISTAMASGWMAIRGTRRRRSVDRGFVISDHVDWPELMRTIEECEPQQVWVTHGFASIVARYLNEHGTPARALTTEFVGEPTDSQDESPDVTLEPS